jgi:hypothetical protein
VNNKERKFCGFLTTEAIYIATEAQNDAECSVLLCVSVAIHTAFAKECPDALMFF